jgi:hypothetical protein
MSERPPSIDTLLAEWPLPGTSSDFADRVLARLESAPVSGRENEKDEIAKILLAPSLSESNNSGTEGAEQHHQRTTDVGGARASQTPAKQEDSAMSSTPNRRSFKDLAKLANGPQSAPPSAIPSSLASVGSLRNEDSGVINLQAPVAEPASGSMPSQPPLSIPVPANSFAPAPLSMPVPVGVAPMAAPSAPVSYPAPPSSAYPAPASVPAPVSQVIAAPPSSAPSASALNPLIPGAPAVPMMTTAAPKKKSNALVIGGAFVGLAALAAGAFLVVKSSRESALPVAKNDVPVAAVPNKVAPTTQGGTTVAAATGDQVAATEQGADPMALPGTAKKPAQGHAVAVGAHAAAPVDTRLPPPVVKEEPAPVAKAEPKKATSGGTGDSLGDAMKKAAGPIEKEEAAPEAKGPQFAPGSVPQKPSQGAVTSALSSVMGGARACAETDTVSRGTVVFTSVGTVQSVSISGDAAGKPAEACMKSALMRAKVAPFAESTFTTSVTIRK